MANKHEKVQENSDGAYYVSSACIGCEECADRAPETFRMKEDGLYAFVHKQPEGEREKEAAEEALDACPADAIGNDG